MTQNSSFPARALALRAGVLLVRQDRRGEASLRQKFGPLAERPGPVRRQEEPHPDPDAEVRTRHRL